MADESTDHVVMAHVEGGWNCSAEELPPQSADIRRPLLLEGEGPGLLYYDVSGKGRVRAACSTAACICCAAGVCCTARRTGAHAALL